MKYILIFLFLTGIAQAVCPNEVTSCKLDRVVDGDTVRVTCKQGSFGVRMLNIDTAETHYLGKNQGPYAYAATDFLKSLLKQGDSVSLSFDVERCDRYDRLLAYVIKDKININYKILEEGYAVPYMIYPNISFKNQVYKIAYKTYKMKRGYYAQEDLELPYIWRRLVSNRIFDYFTVDYTKSCYYIGGDFIKVSPPARIFYIKNSELIKSGIKECSK